MNSLNRDIQSGEKVIIYQHIFPRQPVEKRVFTCMAGPGLYHKDHRTVIFGKTHWGEEGNIYGGWIDPVATRKWQEENPASLE